MEKLKKFERPAVVSEVGMVLFDQSLKPIAFDRGAAAILNYPRHSDSKAEMAGCIPREIWDLIGRRNSKTRSDLTSRVHSGNNEYLCRVYLVEPNSGSQPKPIVALHLEKIWSADAAVEEAGIKFHLTDREQEVLHGISMGFTSNEIAERMNISPNTVRSFFRLIMNKMGVATRSGIVASILKPGESAESGAKHAGSR